MSFCFERLRDMAKSPFLFKILSLYFWREKNLSPDFGVMVFFLDLVDFKVYWVVGLLKSFDRRPLSVWRHVENVFYLKDSRNMASL